MAVVGAKANVGAAGRRARFGRLVPAGSSATLGVLTSLQLFRAEEMAGIRRAREMAGVRHAEEAAGVRRV
ncbi:MAG TPA: hypothetical protein VFG68_17675 [Fimbriiglobus sp.]|nr:hypothetical protein [Fimbriiglobus sp.]